MQNILFKILIMKFDGKKLSYKRVPGADPGFQVRGGALKKIAPSEERREKFWGISCETSRFYAKKSHFFPIAEGGAKIVGVFRISGGGAQGGGRGGRPPLDPSLSYSKFNQHASSIAVLVYYLLINHCLPTWTHYPDSESASLCSFSLMLRI